MHSYIRQVLKQLRKHLVVGMAGVGACVVVTMTPTIAVADQAAASPKSLEADVQSLREDVLSLNKDLSALEEELLFPANTQVAVFLSLDVGAFFELDSVQLRLDNKEVANYLYTEREIAALNRGGVHRVFLGNVCLLYTSPSPRD